MIKKILASLTFALLIAASSVQAQTVVFNEDFETGMDGWTVVVQDTFQVDTTYVPEFAPGWITLADPNNTTDTVCGATSFFLTPGRARRWLISPAINVGSYGNIIRWSARSHDPSYPDDYQVIISTTTNDIASFNDTLAWVYQEDENWFDYEMNIADSGYVDQTVYLAFVLNSYDKFKLYLDDISVTIEDPVGIEETVADWVEMYPNPASSYVRFKTDKTVDAVRFYNSTGQLELTSDYSASKIDVSALPSGIYFVEILSGDAVARKRLVIR